MVRSWVWFSLVLSLALSLWACGGEDKPSLALRELGQSCSTDATCASGVCAQLSAIRQGEGVCSLACRKDDDCQNGNAQGVRFVCGVGPEQAKLCLPHCDSGYHNLTCVDGVTTSCVEAPERACGDCGCPENKRCEPDVGCIDQKEVGEECSENEDCISDNCSATAHVCRVHVGLPCTRDNCDWCLSSSSGYSFCSRKCSYGNECPDGLCLGDTTYFVMPQYRCFPPCGGSCPGACRSVSGEPDQQYCACEGCSIPK